MQLERSSVRARMTDHLPVAVGTTLGLFFISDGVIDGPYHEGCRVPAFLQVHNRYLAAVVDPGGQPGVSSSDDDGQSWSDPASAPMTLPTEAETPLRRVCQLQADRSDARSGAPSLLAGTEPGALFRSTDGSSFEIVRSLWDHPARHDWETPGDRLHSILTHPERAGRIVVGITTAGVFRSDDGGATWTEKNEGISKHAADAWRGERRQVFKLAQDASGPDALFAQTDTGTYHSDDAGDSWTEVSRAGEPDGLSTDFGLTIASHPVETGTAYVFPLRSEWYPCGPQGRPRVYRTSDAGKSWVVLGDGLPPEGSHMTVVAEALSVGATSPYPLVLGTRAGQLFASLDQGEHWRLTTSGLPPVLCVRVLD